MPKSGMCNWVTEFNCFKTDGTIVMCTFCNKSVSANTKFQLKQYTNSIQHKKNENKKDTHTVQTFLATTAAVSATGTDTFSEELCEAFVGANIPLNKIENPKLKAFLEKYCKREIPSERTLRRRINTLYNKNIQKIKDAIGEDHVWIMVDESTDALGRYVCNCIVGSLSPEKTGDRFLLCSKMLDKVNNETVARFCNESLRILWDGPGQEEKLLLMISDAAPYMVKAGKNLRVFYPEMLHVTCVAHAIHRAAEKIRDQFPNVDALISQTKKVFLKAPSRVQVYKELAGDLALPPQPVLTRWGTWINAALFYAGNFDIVKTVIDSFDSQSSNCVLLAQEAFHSKTVKGDLAYILAHFATLPTVLEKLEAKNLPLMTSVKYVEGLKEELDRVPGASGKAVATKFSLLLEKNPSYSTLLQISKVLEGKSSEIPANIKLPNVARYKYAPITSCDVERSFSSYKTILTDRRCNLLPENIEKLLISYCNN